MKLNDKGAASVLVLLLIIVLATFGAIALTTGYSNKNMVSRSVSYFKDYYEADTVCENMVCRIDRCLTKAHNDALSYLEQHYPLYGLPGGVPPADVPGSFRELIGFDHGNSTIQSKKVLEIYRRLYFYYAYENLLLDSAAGGYSVKLSGDYVSGQDFLQTGIDLPLRECPIEIEFTGTGRSEQIDVKLGVVSPKISFILENSINLRYNMRRVYGSGSTRYIVLTWRQRIPEPQQDLEPLYDGKVR